MQISKSPFTPHRFLHACDCFYGRDYFGTARLYDEAEPRGTAPAKAMATWKVHGLTLFVVPQEVRGYDPRCRLRRAGSWRLKAS